MSLAKQRLTVEPATDAHAVQLAAHIRPEDAAEMMASHGLEPLAGLRMALRSSPEPRAILDGKRVVALFGVAPVDAMEGVGSVWLLGGRLVKRLPVAFMRTIAEVVRGLQESWAVLFNMIWTENATALRWVKALGFEVLEPVPFGVASLPFHPVCLRRS